VFTVRWEQHIYNYADGTSGNKDLFVSVSANSCVSVLFSRRALPSRSSSVTECSRLTDLCIDPAEFIKVMCSQPLNDNN
jgi:hypothetical protein